MVERGIEGDRRVKLPLPELCELEELPGAKLQYTASQKTQKKRASNERRRRNVVDAMKSCWYLDASAVL